MPGRVWAIIEAEEGGLFRSDDGGETWQHLTGDANLMQRPWYYSHVVADPQDANTVWVLNLKAWKSTDGGEHVHAGDDAARRQPRPLDRPQRH